MLNFCKQLKQERTMTLFITTNIKPMYCCVENSIEGHCSFLLETPTLTLSKSETLKPIDTKFCTVNYIGDISGCARKYNSRFMGAPNTNAKYITFFVSFLFFCVLRFAHNPNAESHKGEWWLKRRASVAESDFWVPYRWPESRSGRKS